MTIDALLGATSEMLTDKASRPKMPWTSCTTADLLQAIGELVHFSFKYTNTNITGGIRLSSDETLDLPYISLRTIDATSAQLDYCSSTPVSRQAVALLQGRHDELYSGVPPELVAQISPFLVMPTNAAEVNCDLVPHRLRQVIVQDEEGQDVALTPLVSASFFRSVNDRLQEHVAEAAEQAKSSTSEVALPLRAVRRGYLHFGGSNPFNGGKQLIALRRPFWFAAPVEDRNIRRAQAIHYKGIDLGVSAPAVKDTKKWRKRIAHTAAATTKAARAGGDPQVEMVREIARPVIARARAASQQLERMRTFLPTYPAKQGVVGNPDAPLTSPLLPAFMRAMLDPSAQYRGWQRDAAYQIYLRIIGVTFQERTRTATIGLAEHEANRVWVAAIEELF
jgi:hypothetical protein